MRILLANHHLEAREGSELWCLELGSALLQAGHELGVFSFFPGAIAQEMGRRGARVFGPEDGALIEAFSPEVIHLHDSPCLYFFGALRIEAPVLCSFLGVLPPLASAPLVWDGVGHVTYVSEEVRDALGGTGFAQAVPGSIARNWFDDRLLRQRACAAPKQIRCIGVVTNHLDAQLREHLEALRQRRPGLEWHHLGLPHRSVPIDEAALSPFDVIVTIGRTPLFAGAMGKPCLLYDIHGCDGLLEPARLDALASRNFSGRLERKRPSLEELEQLLLSDALRAPVDEVAHALWRDYRLTERARMFERRYAELRGGGAWLSEATRGRYGKLGRIYAETISQLTYWRGRALHAEQAREQAEGRSAQWQGELEARSAELEAQRQELEAMNRALLARLHALEASAERMRELLGAVETSLAWKAISSVRAAKDALLPKGSPRRERYDRALQIAKRRVFKPRLRG